jgi:hypothetical protein
VIAVENLAPLVLCAAPGCVCGYVLDADGLPGAVCLACQGTGISRETRDGCLCGEEHEPEPGGAVVLEFRRRS